MTWTGNLGDGTSHYRATGATTVTTAGRPGLLGSSDPTFHGDRERWNPEQLLAALAQCHMLSYLHVCVNEGVVVTDYVDTATAAISTDPTAAASSPRRCSTPRVTVADASMVEAATRAHHRAHELCFIANSVELPVRHDPEVVVATG